MLVQQLTQAACDWWRGAWADVWAGQQPAQAESTLHPHTLRTHIHKHIQQAGCPHAHLARLMIPCRHSKPALQRNWRHKHTDTNSPSTHPITCTHLARLMIPMKSPGSPGAGAGPTTAKAPSVFEASRASAIVLPLSVMQRLPIAPALLRLRL